VTFDTECKELLKVIPATIASFDDGLKFNMRCGKTVTKNSEEDYN
jgi:hypothetical protein